MFPPSNSSRRGFVNLSKKSRSDNRKRRHRNRLDFERSILLEPLEERVVLTGTWTSVATQMPGEFGVGTMLLLPDGSVMAIEASDTSKNWHKLTPDSTGSYANGTWTTLAPMHQTRLYFGSAVLPDGRVFVVGGEYSDAGEETNTGEIYNPVNDTWTVIANAPPSEMGDASTEVLSDGNVVVSHLFSSNTYIYNVSANTWSTGPAQLHGDTGAEESWVKLSDGSILTYAIGGWQPQQGQRLVLDPNNNHANDRWYDAGTVPVRLDSSGGSIYGAEIGPALRLSDGRVLYAGASGHTALYTPPTTLTGTGSWVAGPDMINSSNARVGAFDAPGAVEANGKVLIATGPIDGINYPGPTTVQEYDPVANTMTIVPKKGGPVLFGPPYTWRMLDLPNGQVLVSDSLTRLHLYTPDSAQLSAFAPNITDIKDTNGTTFTLTGTQLNGFSEGAAYGDDAQMSTNYPIVSLFDTAGHRYYARTSNWSNVGVGTGATSESVNFTLPSGLAAGTYGLQVSASGVISNPVVLVVGTSGDDTLTMNTAGGGVSSFTLNGKPLANWVGGQAGIYLAMEGGNNTVNILNTYADTPVVVAGGGADTINLGGGNSQGLLGQIRIDNVANFDTINIVNSADTVTRLVTLNTYNAYDGQWGSIVGLTPGGVSYRYSATHTLNITNGSGNDITNVLATDPIATTSIDGTSGNDNVNIGANSGRLSGILGPVTVGQSLGGGATTLTINDLFDSAARTFTVNNSSVTTSGVGAINYKPGQVGALNLQAGNGGNTFVVLSTGARTAVSISAGGGTNTINVQGTSAALTINNQGGLNYRDNVLIGGSNASTAGSLAGIAGPITVGNASGTSSLTVDDRNDTTARTYAVSNTSISGAGLPTINYASLSALTLNCGFAGNTVNVRGTAPGIVTVLNSGGLADQVNVQATNGGLTINGIAGADTVAIGGLAPASGGTLSGIAGPITLANLSGSTALIVDDSGDTTARTSVVTKNSITGLAPFPITYSNLSSLTVRTPAAGGSSTNVQSTSVPTTIIGNSPVGGPDDTALVGLGGSVSGIAAALNFSSTTGFTSITVDDSADTAAETVIVTDHSISGIAPGLISYVQNRSRAVTINSGKGGNTFNVTSTGSRPTLTINTGTGSVQVNIGDATNTLNSILGNVSVVKGTGSATLKINDQGSSANHAYTLGANSFGRSDTGTISFPGVNSILVNGGLGNDTYLLAATPTVNISLNDYGGVDTLAGPNVANLWTIATIFGKNIVVIGGLFAINIDSLLGGAAADTFKFAQGGNFSGSINGGGGTNTVDESAYTTATTVNLATSSVSGVAGGFNSIQTFIGGVSSANLVTGPAAAATYNLTALNAFNVNGVTFTGIPNITGGAAENSFVLGNGAGLSGSLNGGGGTNWLDYSAYSTDISVNLANGTATGFGGNINNIYNVRGSALGTDNLTGNSKGNILIGGGGTNTITGGTGVSLLIGGKGGATINGGSGGDLIIGGYTTLDKNNAALDAILAEWQSADTYANRINFIKNGGGLNGGYTLNSGTTVVDNLATNVLTGAAGGKNWYFKGAKTKISNLQPGEQVN